MRDKVLTTRYVAALPLFVKNNKIFRVLALNF